MAAIRNATCPKQLAACKMWKPCFAGLRDCDIGTEKAMHVLQRFLERRLGAAKDVGSHYFCTEAAPRDRSTAHTTEIETRVLL